MDWDHCVGKRFQKSFSLVAFPNEKFPTPAVFCPIKDNLLCTGCVTSKVFLTEQIALVSFFFLIFTRKSAWIGINLKQC